MLIPRPQRIVRSLFVKKRLRKVPLTTEEIRAVMVHYDLGSWQVVRALGGGHSDNILLQTGRGRKVLKRYHWSLPSTMQEHSILLRLAHTDFPCPRLEFNKEGSTYTEIGQRHYAIYDFVQGYCSTDYLIPITHRQKLGTQAGETLARFHQLMTGFVPEGRKLNGFMPDGKRLWRDLDWHLGILDQYVEKTSKEKTLDDHDSFVLSILDEMRSDLIEVGRFYEQDDPQLEKFVNHGDFSPKNILFNWEGVAAVLDFGDANLNLRALDVARGISTFASLGKYGIDERLSRVFLLGYQSREALCDKEIESIPSLVSWRYLQNIVWALFHVIEDYHDQNQRIAHLTSCRDKWERACWVKDHSEELQESLLSVKDF